MEGQVPIGHVPFPCQNGEVVSGNGTPFAADVVARFWAKVQKTEGCWLWTASRSGGRRHGTYGQFTYTVDKRQRHISAHAFSFILHHGPVPEGCEVMHLCDRHICVRPDHLKAGTRKENVRDAVGKGFYHVPHPKSQKLSDQQVDEMVRLVQSGILRYVVAQQFGVSKTYVTHLMQGRLRKHRPSTKKEQAA
jgi:hypothetical protein